MEAQIKPSSDYYHTHPVYIDSLLIDIENFRNIVLSEPSLYDWYLVENTTDLILKIYDLKDRERTGHKKKKHTYNDSGGFTRDSQFAWKRQKKEEEDEKEEPVQLGINKISERFYAIKSSLVCKFQGDLGIKNEHS